MRSALKWSGIGLGSLVVIIIATIAVLSFRGRSMSAAAPDVAVRRLAIPTDSNAIARGRHIARTISSCGACHGDRLEGKKFEMPDALVSMSAPNLTRGRGGIGATYSAQDWDRAIRHGVAKDGRRLVVMPSDSYSHMSDTDFASLVAYLTSVDPVDTTHAPRRIGLVGGALLGSGAMQPPVNVIAHDRVGADSTPTSSPEALGAYLVTLATCKDCHGPELAGRKDANGPPPGPSLVSHATAWSAEDFRKTIRTGGTPSGKRLNAKQMPWPWYANMTDAELDAIWAYVRSLPTRTPSAT